MGVAPVISYNYGAKNTGGLKSVCKICRRFVIVSEFMPVSLLTLIAHDLHVTEGLAGQGIAVSGALAVLTLSLIHISVRLLVVSLWNVTGESPFATARLSAASGVV